MWAVSNRKISGQNFAKPLVLTPGATTTYNLESATYKNLYTNQITCDGTTHVATVLLPKVAENKGAILYVSHIAGANYSIFSHQTAENSGANVFTASATTAGQSAVLYCDGVIWTVLQKQGTTTV
jgi:hypothetical protein